MICYYKIQWYTVYDYQKIIKKAEVLISLHSSFLHRAKFQLRGMETDMDNSISAASSVETFNEKKSLKDEN